MKKDFITNKWWYGVGSIILPETQFMFLRLCIHAHVPNICTASKALRFWAQTTLWFKGPTTSSSKPQLSSKQDCKNLRQINLWIFGLESKQLLPHLTSCALMGWAWIHSICRASLGPATLCWSQFRTDPAPTLPWAKKHMAEALLPTLQQNIGTCTHVSRLICDLCCPKNEWRMLETNRNVRSSKWRVPTHFFLVWYGAWSSQYWRDWRNQSTACTKLLSAGLGSRLGIWGKTKAI